MRKTPTFTPTEVKAHLKFLLRYLIPLQCWVFSILLFMKDELFSSVGRIGPVAYIVRVLISLALVVLVYKVSTDYFLHDEKHAFLIPLAYFFTIVMGIIALMTILMQSIKRLHDIGKGPIWAALIFVPGLNILFVLYASVMPSKS